MAKAKNQGNPKRTIISLIITILLVGIGSILFALLYQPETTQRVANEQTETWTNLCNSAGCSQKFICNPEKGESAYKWQWNTPYGWNERDRSCSDNLKCWQSTNDTGITCAASDPATAPPPASPDSERTKKNQYGSVGALSYYYTCNPQDATGQTYLVEERRGSDRERQYPVSCPANTMCVSRTEAIECVDRTANSTSDCPGGKLDYGDYELCLSNSGTINNSIDPTVKNFSINFRNLPTKEGDQEFFMCLKSDPKDCDDDDIKNKKLTRNSDGTASTEELCGDGKEKLKTGCDDEDYFHQEKTYRVTLFEKNKVSSAQVGQVSIYISHFYPKVTSPIPDTAANSRMNINGIRANGNTLKVTLDGKNIAEGEFDLKKNDYWIRLDGIDNDYSSESGCLLVNEVTLDGSINLSLPSERINSNGDPVKLVPGKYILRIKDGANLKGDISNPTCSEGEFTFYHIPITIGSGGNPGSIGKAIRDPYFQESGITAPRVSPQPVCDEVDENGYCTSIKTALGISIKTDPKEFVGSIMSFILGIAGVIAFIFFIQAGYTILTSAGNKEKVGQAREQITSAIMGLIFIILSIAIFEFIGVNILRLPGFTNSSSGGQSAPVPTKPPITPPNQGGTENDDDLRPGVPVLN